MIRNRLYRFLAFLLLLCSFSLAFTFPSNAASFNLALTQKTLTVGTSATLKVPGVSNSKIKWKSSAPSIVSVSRTGKIKAKKAGVSTISGKYKGITFKCKITVLTTKINKLLYSKNGISIRLARITTDSVYYTITNNTKDDWCVYVDFFVLGNKSYFPSNLKTIPYGTTVVFRDKLWDEKITNPNAKTFSAKFVLDLDDAPTSVNAISVRTKTIRIH